MRIYGCSNACNDVITVILAIGRMTETRVQVVYFKIHGVIKPHILIFEASSVTPSI